MGLAVERFAEARWVPPWIRRQHVARYQWVSQVTVGCTVVDAACGTGYGARMIAARGAKQVTGFDLSAEAIEEANRCARMDRVSFEVADVTKLPVADHSYDVFVSLETIEHVENDRALVREAARVLKEGGRFICSTPNRLVTNPGISIKGKPFNPYHVREYSAPELEMVLRPSFRSVAFFGQSMYGKAYVKLLRAVGGVVPMAAVRLHQMRKLAGTPWERPEGYYPMPMPGAGEPEYLVAVCTA